MIKCYVDEVGYASISGPIGICAIVADDEAVKIENVKDSKKLSKKQREGLYDVIIKNVIDYEFGAANIKLIKKMNIHYARYYAMKVAIEKLMNRNKIEEVIVDGKFIIPGLNIKQQAVIKADDKIWQVGAASILAKVMRDRMMANLSKIDKFSHYGWDNNAGYFTPAHLYGIMEYGPCELHRVNNSFYRYAIFEHDEYKNSNKTIDEFKDFMQNHESKIGMNRYTYWKQLMENVNGKMFNL